MGAVKVQSLNYYTVVYMYFVRFRAGGRKVNFFFNLETEDIPQGELFFTLGKVLTMQIVLEHHQARHKFVI